MKNLIPEGTLTSVVNLAKAHKVGTAILVAVFLGVVWWGYSSLTGSDGQTRYVVAAAERGTIVASVSASGQIAASRDVDLKPGASGDITYVGVKEGQSVRAGQLLVRLDSGDTAYELESAQLEYEELVTVDASEVRDARDTVSKASGDLKSAYVSAQAALADATTNMTNTLGSLDDLYGSAGYLSTHSNTSNETAREYRDRARDAWYDASDALEEFVKVYQAAPVESLSEDTFEDLLDSGYTASLSVAQAAKYAQDAVSYMRDRDMGNSSTADEAYTSVTELVATANDTVSALSSDKTAIANNKRTLASAEKDLADIEDGPDELDIRKSLAVRQKQKALADYSVYAPFDGIISSVDAEVGESASSGTAVATLISSNQLAEISLSEVDAVKIEVGQKATLTFDAIEDLTLTGTVAKVDAAGTVDQGVVSYGVTIALDSQDNRIKSGMTANAAIQTETATDVLIVPASAVKTQSGQSYVLAFNPPLEIDAVTANQGVETTRTPTQVPVETGISDDTSVEIVSGLSEGQQIVVRTTTGTAAASGTVGATASSGGGGPPAGAVMRAF